MSYTFKPSLISRVLAVINGLVFAIAAYWVAAGVFNVARDWAILIAVAVGTVEAAIFYFLLSHKWIGSNEVP